MSLSKEEKKLLKNKWKAGQRKKLLLSRAQAKKLFAELQRRLDEGGCDETLRYTQRWLEQNFSDEARRARVLEEIREMGGLCDCEVLLNCYEEYELET